MHCMILPHIGFAAWALSLLVENIMIVDLMMIVQTILKGLLQVCVYILLHDYQNNNYVY